MPETTAPNVSLRRNIIRAPISRTERYDNSFFPFCINNWNNTDDTIKSLPSLNEFKNKLCKFIRPEKSSFYNIRESYGIKLSTKIRVSFSDKFNCDNPTCLCGLEDETVVHFFLCCPRYDQLRIAYLSKVSEIVGSDVTVLPNDHLTPHMGVGVGVAFILFIQALTTDLP